VSTNRPRPRSRPLPDRQIAEIIAELQALERSVQSDGSAVAKDTKAKRALLLAGILVDSLAGWAIDHEIGLAVAGALYEPLDLEPVATEGLDDEQFGALGAAYDWSNAAVNRRALANLLAANAGAFPRELALECALGLEALQLDETRVIFERRARRLEDARYRMAMQRLRAVEHAIFYENAGAAPADAEAKVAVAYEIDVDRLRRWRHRLPYLLGTVSVRENLERAAHSGLTARRLGLPLCEAEVRRRDQQLRVDAARHRAARRELHERARRMPPA